MSVKLEKVVEKFYEGLEDGKFLGRKCKSAEPLNFLRFMHATLADAWIWNGSKSAEKP